MMVVGNREEAIAPVPNAKAPGTVDEQYRLV